MGMREIKFRAWDLGTKKMVDHNGLLCNVIPGKEMRRDYDPFNNDELLVIMQFTGLLDRNGQKIWEGDIIRYTNNDGMTRVGVVDWLDDEACFYLNSLPLWEQAGKEVVGNIYEHPEMMEEI